MPWIHTFQHDIAGFRIVFTQKWALNGLTPGSKMIVPWELISHLGPWSHCAPLRTVEGTCLEPQGFALLSSWLYLMDRHVGPKNSGDSDVFILLVNSSISPLVSLQFRSVPYIRICALGASKMDVPNDQCIYGSHSQFGRFRAAQHRHVWPHIPRFCPNLAGQTSHFLRVWWYWLTSLKSDMCRRETNIGNHIEFWHQSDHDLGCFKLQLFAC